MVGHDMSIRIGKRVVLGLAVLAIQNAAVAFEEQEVHLHGFAKMDIASEGSKIEVMFSSPQYNIVGFEHPAVSREDQEQLTRAKHQLEEVDALIQFSQEAECRADQVRIEFAVEVEREGSRTEFDLNKIEHAHDEHEHEHEHEAEGHQNILAHYRFICANPAALRQLRVGMFSVFPKLQQLDLNLLSDHGAKKFELNADKSVVNF